MKLIHFVWFESWLETYTGIERQNVNPLSPHDAIKHHFKSPKTDLIVPQLRVLERKFPRNWFTNTWQFSLLFHPSQLIFIRYKSRIATEIRDLWWMKMTMINSGFKGLNSMRMFKSNWEKSRTRPQTAMARIMNLVTGEHAV